MLRIYYAAILVLAVALPSFATDIQWGINGHPLSGAAYEDTLIDFHLDLIEELGMTHYRIDINQDASGLLSSSDEAQLNSLISACASRNITIYPVLSLPGALNAADAATAWQAGFSIGSQFAADFGNSLDYYGLGNNADDMLESHH